MDKQTNTKQAAELRQSDSSKLLAVRPVEFKAWDHYNNKWAERYIVGDLLYEMHSNNNQWVSYTLVQFTGKLDTPGTKIFEGDIYTIEGGVYIVVFSVEESAFMLRVIDPAPVSAEVKDELLYMPGNGEGRILGNIFEHPYLLLGKRTKHS